MKKIATLVGRDLKWTQPSARRLDFELHAGDELAATLRFPSAFKCDAVAESADGAWRLSRAGWFTNSARVIARDSGEEVAFFQANAFRHCGTLKLSGGRTLRVSGSIWGNRYRFFDASEQPLMELRNRGCFHHSATVVLRPSAGSLPELPVVVLLGWFLSFMSRNDVFAVVNVGLT